MCLFLDTRCKRTCVCICATVCMYLCYCVYVSVLLCVCIYATVCMYLCYCGCCELMLWWWLTRPLHTINITAAVKTDRQTDNVKLYLQSLTPCHVAHCLLTVCWSSTCYQGVTECYECEPKPAQKSYPGCTIRNTPSEPIHCIVWAKHLFKYRSFLLTARIFILFTTRPSPAADVEALVSLFIAGSGSGRGIQSHRCCCGCHGDDRHLTMLHLLSCTRVADEVLLSREIWLRFQRRIVCRLNMFHFVKWVNWMRVALLFFTLFFCCGVETA